MRYIRSNRFVAKLLYFTLSLVFQLAGCSTTVKYLTPYHPSEHKVVLVLLPQGKSGETLGKVLDRLDNPPYRIVSITEEECRLRADLSQLFDKNHGMTPDIACAIAKSVSATLVIFSERGGEGRRSEGGHEMESGEGERGEGGGHRGQGEGGGYGGGHCGHRGGGGEGGGAHRSGASRESQFIVFDAHNSKIVWREMLNSNPSDSDLKGFAKRLVTDTEPKPTSDGSSAR